MKYLTWEDTGHFHFKITACSFGLEIVSGILKFKMHHELPVSSLPKNSVDTVVSYTYTFVSETKVLCRSTKANCVTGIYREV